jgi:hypothetical protein
MIISARERSEAICQWVVEEFARQIPDCYSLEDRRRGYITTAGRDGKIGNFPFVSISMGIVDCDFRTSVSMEELSHRVAEAKKFAKSRPGNSYVRDRRTPLGAEK